MIFHHIGFAVANIEKERDYYHSLGASDITQIYDDGIQNVRVLFFMLGGVRHELVAPLGPGSPVDSFLKKNIRIYHTCYEVSDLKEKISLFLEQGSLLVLPPTQAIALNNRKISFLMTRSGDLIELLSSSDENQN